MLELEHMFACGVPRAADIADPDSLAIRRSSRRRLDQCRPRLCIVEHRTLGGTPADGEDTIFGAVRPELPAANSVGVDAVVRDAVDAG